jgi:hypothetical protein
MLNLLCLSYKETMVQPKDERTRGIWDIAVVVSSEGLLSRRALLDWIMIRAGLNGLTSQESGSFYALATFPGNLAPTPVTGDTQSLQGHVGTPRGLNLALKGYKEHTR